MGRPPSNGGPSFRFNQSEIAEMEAILQAHKTAMPAREVLVSLAEKFSNSEERSGKIEVQMKQVWNWFQNRRYAIRAKAAKSPGKLNVTPMTREDSSVVKGVPQAIQPNSAPSATARSLPQATQHPTGPSAMVRNFPQAPQHPAAFSVQSAGRVADNSQMEYEAKSARDGAWYDVSTFLSHRSLETGDPEVLVRFAGFGAEEDEWVNVRKNVRQRSLPCESSECVAVLPADLILCFQEGKEQALYFDAHVLDAQRRRHDVRGCRCRFLVRYDHDQSEEIVALRKICRRPETDYRLQQLHAANDSLSANQNKNGANNVHTVSTLRVYPPAEVQPKLHKVEPTVHPSPAEVPQKRQKVDSTVPAPPPEGSQRQFKVEPVALAPPSGEVPQNQHKVQPVLPDPSAEASLEPQKVEPMVPDPSAQTSLQPQKAESMVPAPSAEASVEVQKVEATVPALSAEVPIVQSVVPDPSTEVSVEPQKAETVVPSPSEKVKQELQTVETTGAAPSTEVSPEMHKVQPMVAVPSAEIPVESPHKPITVTAPPPAVVPVEPHKGEPELSEPQKVSAELHEVQPMVTEPHMNAVEEPVVTAPPTDPEVNEAEIQQPKVPEITSNNNDILAENVDDVKHAKVAEMMGNDNVGSSKPPPENTAVASDDATNTVKGGSDSCQDMEEG